MLVLRPEGVLARDGYHAGWAVTVADGCIVGLGPAVRQSDHDVPLPGRVLVAGRVNAHSHAFQRAIRGHVQRGFRPGDDFWSWRDAMYRAANTLDDDGFYAVSRLVFLEMAEAGVTTVGEFHYVHHQPDGTPYADPDTLARAVIAAALDVGLRIVLLRVVYGRGGPGLALREDQRRFRDQSPDDALGALQRLSHHHDERVTVGLAPHSVRAVPPDWLGALSSWRGPVHAHVAEQPAEVSACFAETGRSPLEVFADAGLLGSQFTAVHLTHPSDGDLALLAAAGGTACVCPTTELDLGDGFFPGADFAGRVSIGTDSHASVDPWLEARLWDGVSRARAGRRGVHGGAARVLDAGGPAGRRCLGLSDADVEIGAPADLVAIDVSGPRLAGAPVAEAVAFAATAGDVTDVFVGGRRIVTDRRHPRRDTILAEALPFLRVAAAN